jgi:hypothetical protein
LPIDLFGRQLLVSTGKFTKKNPQFYCELNIFIFGGDGKKKFEQ